MTFSRFAAIAAAYRPDAVVHAHGVFGGVTDVAVYFIKPDGSHSKVYHYRGSYADILNRLGIRVVTSTDMATVEYQLRLAKEVHGKPSLFSKGKPVDRSAEIARLEILLERYKSDEFVRDWE